MVLRLANRPKDESKRWHKTVPDFDNSPQGDTLARLPYSPHGGQSSRPLAEVYSPVQRGYIRVVHIQGFDDDGLLVCSLDTQALTDEAAAPYTAISYTWSEGTSIWYGKPRTKDKPIKVNGIVVSVRSKIADILCLAQ
jgi:hypothetical protein